MATEQDPTGSEIETDAFKQLYPEQFFERFFSEGLRPDGRTLGRARPLNIGLGAISSAAGSCLAKLGSTAVLAGVRASVGEQPERPHMQDLPAAAGAALGPTKPPPMGVLKVNVELAPFATPDARSSQAQEVLARLAQRLDAVLRPLRLPEQLAIADVDSSGGRPAAYHVQLDAYVLDADGALFDALLLAVLGALSSARLPDVVPAGGGAVGGKQRVAAVAGGGAGGGRRLVLRRLPLAVSCALAGAHLLVDPTRDEEAVAGGGVCVVLDAQGDLHALYKTGGMVAATPMTLLRCIEAAKLRYHEIADQLSAALAAYHEQQQQH